MRSATSTMPIAPLTAFTRTVMSDQEMVKAVSDAFAVFESQRPRPVVLEFPLDVLSAPADVGHPKRMQAPRPKAKPADLDAATKLIDGSMHPLLLVGRRHGRLRTRRARLPGEVRRHRRYTTAGKGVIPASHPQSLPSALLAQPVQQVLTKADVVIAVGTELAETDSGSIAWISRQAHPDRSRCFTITRDYAPTVAIEADAGETLEALTPPDQAGPQAGQRPDPRRPQGGEGRHEAARAQACQGAGRPARCAASNGIVVSDMTQIAYTPPIPISPARSRAAGSTLAASAHWAMRCRRRSVPRSPARIAPWSTVCGDGGFLFTVQELGTRR